ncbi:MAG: chitobiase/beta-hexosaminidase C-terminal domain-containing protein [Candidatus Amulumruptor sp.]
MKKFLTFFAMLCALLGFSPHASADIRLMGGGSGDRTTGILMNQVGSSNDYTCEVNITSSNKTIKVKDNGTWRGYKNNNSTWTASSFPASNTLSSTGATGDDITIDKAGTYVVTYNSSSNKLTISPVLYFVGNMTGWNLDTTKKFTCVGSVYTLTLASGISNPNSGDTGWKIWNGTWGYNFGSGGTDPTVGGNEVNAWFKAAANYETTTTSAVQIQFTLLSDKDGDATVDGKVKLISAGPTKPAAPTISASGNTVTITKTGSGDIWYTTNGDDPTKDTSTRTRYTASFTIERGKTTTVKAAVVSGGEWSDITSKNIYVGAAPTVKEITLYTRDDIKNGNSGRGTATAAGADGIWKVASVSIPSDANSGYWNSTLSVKVTYSDNTSAWYSTTQNTDVNTIQANGWKNTFVRSTWPVSSTANCGFFVENSGGKTVTVYARFIGDDLQISAVMPYNALTIGSSTPQITGYGIPSDSWNNYKDFSKVSDSPKSYEYVFTCGNANDNKEYVWYGLKINGTQYRPANLSLGESTYTFTAGAPSSSNQATIKGLTTGVNYALVLTETEMGLRLTITEAGVPKPVFTRAAESNVVTVNVPDGCTLHYTVNGGAEQTATSRVTLTIPTDGMTVSAYFTKDGETGETVNGSFDYYTAPQRWASKEWSLSDDGIMPRNSVKYFYMSRYQNDDRVSPEWELVKNGDTYTLDYFMCIPAAEFRLRRIAKDNNGAITYRDFGLDAVEKITPTSIGATSATVGTADAPKTVSKNYTVYGGSYDNKSRGYAWDLGYSLVSVKVTDATDGNNAYGNNTLQMTLSVDFSHPSTANVAPIKGMPYVALTGSKLQIPTIAGQNIKHATELPDGYSNAFTNAWIQYDEDSNMLVYGDNVTGKDYYSGGSYHKPENGAVMNSTILPPRYPIWFKLVDEEGNETNVTSNKTVLKYKGQETRKFKTPNGTSTNSNVKFAVYALNDMEMSGLFKIYSGYGGFRYGKVENGLSLHSNWGVGHQPEDKPYDYSTIPSGVAMPLNGGGPKTKADGTAERDPANSTSEGYGNEDNYAGRYFGFDKRTYVSELNFYYALEPDTWVPANADVINSNPLVGGGGDDANYNSHHADDATMNINNPTNDGRNFSWFRFVYTGLFGKIDLKKEGFNTGRVTWGINDKKEATNDKILNYQVTFYQVDTTAPQGQANAGTTKTVVAKQAPANEKYVETAFELEPDLEPGWYEAKLEYWVDTFDEDGNALPNQYKIAYSPRILIFKMSAADIVAKQRVTKADDGVRVYHPVIDVTPDASSSIKALNADTDVKTVYATITVDGISDNAVTRIVDMDGNDFPNYGSGAEGITVEYKRADRQAIVHYPEGFFTSRTQMPDMRFAVRNAAIDARTDFSMTIASSEGLGATSTDNATVYMPAGVLYGKLVPQAVESDINPDVEFNALGVTNQDNLPAGEAKDGYARIRYVDKNNGDDPCYIGTMGGTSVMAEIKYIGNDGTEKVLFGGEKLDMRLNPDDNNAVYTAKRLKIAGIPYETETAIDAAGETINVRKDQSAKFSVQLTYTIPGYDPFVSRLKETTLTYKAEELTSPRKGLADLKTKDDLRGETSADGKTVATDVTAISESFVENYGGLITNIEDAHVALQAVPKHEKLIGYDSFDKWYMDHGDKYDDAAATPNPHSPAKRRAIGHTDLAGTTTFAAPAEVHPLLREDGAPVKVASDFQNTTTVNNAWWNSAASVAPVFHKSDHIKGDFVCDSKGNITAWTSESKIQKPAQHREYWAGVMAGNNKAYKENVWNNGIIERENGVSVDIRDPKHGYYDMASHFASVTDESGAEKEVRSAYHLGEMPLNANDVMALYGNSEDPHGVASYLGEYSALRSVVLPIHDQMSEEIAKAKFTDCKASVTIDGVTYKLDYPEDEPWNYGNTWKTRAELAFNSSNAAGLAGKSPAEAIFAKANNHMVFKVNHVNHESWFVPNGIPQGTPKTYSLWEAFKGTRFGSVAFNDLTTDKQKDDYIMSVIRMELDDYCPLAYDVRYTYPFLTTEHVTAENYNNAKTRAAATEDFNRINNMLAAVTPAEVTPVAARDTGRVPFFSNMTTSPEDVVPTAISDVNDDIRGNGFSIVYNRAAGTVTVTAEGDRQLKDAAVYDATGASLITGTSADRISDQIIVLDVRNIARGAYVVSTNLGGAKFMK